MSPYEEYLLINRKELLKTIMYSILEPGYYINKFGDKVFIYGAYDKKSDSLYYCLGLIREYEDGTYVHTSYFENTDFRCDDEDMELFIPKNVEEAVYEPCAKLRFVLTTYEKNVEVVFVDLMYREAYSLLINDVSYDKLEFYLMEGFIDLVTLIEKNESLPFMIKTTL